MAWIPLAELALDPANIPLVCSKLKSGLATKGLPQKSRVVLTLIRSHCTISLKIVKSVGGPRMMMMKIVLVI